MSRTIKKEITCPACGEKADAKMWASVNVTLDQELRESVLDESLFTWTCPQCGHDALLSYPCLYHDMANKFMIYLVPRRKAGEPERRRSGKPLPGAWRRYQAAGGGFE